VGGALVPLGRIELAGFSNPDGLVSAGDGLLEETAASGPAGPADGFIVQGGLEASGTDYADAAVTQITASRSYTALASVFRTADEMQGSLLDMLA
jgi:flagellar hook protein FlgE